MLERPNNNINYLIKQCYSPKENAFFIKLSNGYIETFDNSEEIRSFLKQISPETIKRTYELYREREKREKVKKLLKMLDYDNTM